MPTLNNMIRLIEVESLKTFKRSNLKHDTYKKGNIFEHNGEKWKVTRVYHAGWGY